MKKETRNRIIKWSLYGVLVVATILIFAFSMYIFGAGKDSIQKTLPNGSVVVETIWTKQDPMFFNSNTGSAFADYFLEHAIPHTLRTIQIAGVAITFAIAVHYLAKIVFRRKKGKNFSRV